MPDRTAVPDPRRWWTLVVLSASLLVIGLDNTILNVALPTLESDLGASSSQLQWIVDAYMLVFAGLLLTAGALGDRFGRKRALTVGLAVFGLGSGLSALATAPEMLIGARAIMGIGGAFIMPSTLSIIMAVFPAHERPKAIGVWAGVSGLGIAIGPVAGGWLIEHASWNAVFLVNLPFVVAALVAGRWLVPDSKDPAAPRLDVPGFALSIAGLTTLVWAIIEAPARGWTSPTILDRLRPRRRGARVLPGLGAAHPRADARHPAVPQPALLGCERRDHAGVLRDVRDDLLPDAVPAGRARLLRARGRPAGDADRARADPRRPDLGEARRAHRDEARRDRRARCSSRSA